MEKLTLCKKHFYDVAGYFDKEVAFAFEIEESSCLICRKILFLESARRYAQQNNRYSEPQTTRAQAA